LPYVSRWAYSSENSLVLGCESRIEHYGFCYAVFEKAFDQSLRGRSFMVSQFFRGGSLGSIQEVADRSRSVAVPHLH